MEAYVIHIPTILSIHPYTCPHNAVGSHLKLIPWVSVLFFVEPVLLWLDLLLDVEAPNTIS